MKKIEINYFIPENTKELESLVGKLVGVKITYANSPSPMVYFGLIDEEHEFLQQCKDSFLDSKESYSTNRVRSWKIKKEHLRFDDGVVLCPDCRHIVSYKLSDENFQDRCKLLKFNGLWEEPKR